MKQGLRWQQLDTRRRQFDGERQAVQTRTDLGDGAGIGLGQLKGRLDGLGTLHEEAHGSDLREGLCVFELCEVRLGERRHRECIFAGEVQGSPAGYQEMQAGARDQQSSQLW